MAITICPIPLDEVLGHHRSLKELFVPRNFPLLLLLSCSPLFRILIHMVYQTLQLFFSLSCFWDGLHVF